jgi:EmrB/QacA subfamily drug resistance transporter
MVGNESRQDPKVTVARAAAHDLGATDDARKWLVLAGVVTSVRLATIDGSIVNVALPTMRDAFATSFEAVQWVVLSYFLTMATATLPLGRLGDVVGRKRLYVSGLTIFTAASVLCGLAPSIEVLVACRVLQAVGGTMMVALAPSILVDAFPQAERGKALGLVWAAVAIGIVIGPVLGGVLIAFVDWRAIFLVNAPLGIVGAWLAARYVRATRPPRDQRMDYLGAALLGVSLLCLSLGLTLGQTQGFGAPSIVGLFAAALAAGSGFVAVQLRRSNPLIDLRILRAPLLPVSVIAGFVTFAASSATIFLLPFYLQGVLGYAAAEIGVLLAVAPLAMGVSSPVAGALSDRLGVRRLTLAGLVILCAAYAGLTMLGEATRTVSLVALWIPIGVGMGVFQSPNSSAIMGAVPPEDSGVASGLLTMTRLLGQLTGVAVIGSIWSARVAAHAGGLPFESATAASASAQVAGLHDIFALAAVLMGGAAALTIYGLRKQGRRSSE